MDLIEKEKLNLPVELYRKICSYKTIRAHNQMWAEINTFENEDDPYYFAESYFDEFSNEHDWCEVCKVYKDTGYGKKQLIAYKSGEHFENTSPYSEKRLGLIRYIMVCKGECNKQYVENLAETSLIQKKILEILKEQIQIKEQRIQIKEQKIQIRDERIKIRTSMTDNLFDLVYVLFTFCAYLVLFR